MRDVGGTASASSINSAAYPAADAFDKSLRGLGDGTNDNLWASASTAPPHWLQYDFGTGNEVRVNAIGMFARQPTFVHQMPTDFVVQWSDDAVEWITAWSESGITWGGFEYKRFVNPSYAEPAYSGSPHGSHPYWRVWISRSEDGSNSPAVGEMQFRATPGGADQATGGTPSASSVWTTGSTLPASNAFDDDPDTLWSSINGSDWG